MCIANIANQVEFLNLVSNEDQRDDERDPIREAIVKAGAQAVKDLEVERRKAEMFDELVKALSDADEAGLFDRAVSVAAGINHGYRQTCRDVTARARKLQQGELS